MMLEPIQIKCSCCIRHLLYVSVSLVALAAYHTVSPTIQDDQTVPSNPRAFVSFLWDEILTNQSVLIQFRWSAVYSTDLSLFFNVSVLDLTKQLHSTYIVSGKERQLEIYNARKNALFSFMVKICWERFCGLNTAPILANTSVDDPPPVLILVESKEVKFYYPDTNALVTLLNHSVAAIYIVTYDDSIFWIHNHSNKINLETGSSSRTLTVTENKALSMSVDWIGRSIFWLERKNHDSYVRKYDISRPLENSTVVVSFVETVNGTIHFIQVDPFQSMIYISWSHLNESATLSRCRYDDGQKFEVVLGFKIDQKVEKRKNCNCFPMILHPVFVLDNRKNEHSNISLYFVDVRTGYIWGSDKDACICRIIRNISIMEQMINSQAYYPQFSLTVDHNHLYWIWGGSGNAVYSINKHTGSDYHVAFGTWSSISYILGYNAVPLPDRDCLRISSQNHTIELVGATPFSLFLRFSMLISWFRFCETISLPSVFYVLRYSEVESNKVNTIEAIYESEYILNDLKPFTSYSISFGASNYFVSLWKNYSMSSPAIFTTAAGIPLTPINVSVTVLTPNALMVKWCMTVDPHHNLMEIIYAVEWISGYSTKLQKNGTVWISNPKRGSYLAETLHGLEESQNYVIRVLAYDSKLTGHSSSSNVTAETFQCPNLVRLLSATENSLRIAWSSPSDNSIRQFAVEYAEADGSTEDLLWLKHLMNGDLMEVLGPNIESTMEILGLKSDQAYAFRTTVIFNSSEPYSWPTENFSTFYTLSNKPGSPGTPYISNNSLNSGLVMEWLPPRNQSLVPVDGYQLICSHADEIEKGVVVYTGNSLFWSVTNLTQAASYVCRVRARNQYGWGLFSNWSSAFLCNQPSVSSNHDTSSMIETFLIPVLVLFFLALIIASVVFVIRLKSKTSSDSSSTTDTDKAGHHLMNSLEPQKLYAINDISVSEKILNELHNFDRDQIHFSRFIRETRNGDLFEGLVDEVHGSGNKKLSVILRTINNEDLCEKDAEDQMKEITFMNRMKHRNIISLLGVCFLGNPQIVIFEKPDHGDLLSLLHKNQAFGLQELLNFCLDIVCGCQFFEERRLVHRDLGARNCFLFCRTSFAYRVKIGGFGLIKDIYRTEDKLDNDPSLSIEWMAPEILTDNLFTGMSDVWAFGVLLWEIFSGGMIPYSEISCKSDDILLQYFNDGNRLKKPDRCPQDVFSVMVSCWRSSPFNRPSFNYIADQLRKAKEAIDDLSRGDRSLGVMSVQDRSAEVETDH